MTNIDIIAMAHEAGIDDPASDWMFWNAMERFAELVRADERNSWPAEMEAMERQVNILTDALAQEREACAKVCDVLANDYGKAGLPMTYQALAATAKEIRARSNT